MSSSIEVTTPLLSRDLKPGDLLFAKAWEHQVRNEYSAPLFVIANQYVSDERKHCFVTLNVSGDYEEYMLEVTQILGENWRVFRLV